MLLLDAGNSRCKWALVNAGKWTHHGAVGISELETLRQDFAHLPPPGRILISNVAGAGMAERLRALCTRWPDTPEFVIAQTRQCGISNGYPEPQRLGSDRWVAMIAAWRHVQSACLVVNCGTATTIDALSARGEFMGGLILPGVYLMQQSLLGGTAQLDRANGVSCAFPLNTADAIHNGVLRATTGAIEYQFALLAKDYARARCVLSGGAAEQVQSHLSMPLDCIDNLVLHGLQVIGENEE